LLPNKARAKHLQQKLGFKGAREPSLTKENSLPGSENWKQAVVDLNNA